MTKVKHIIFIIIVLLNVSCTKKNEIISKIEEKDLELQVFEAYKEGLRSLEEGDVLFAAKKFNEAEILFPQSEWAPRSSLMAAYSYYSQEYYIDSIAELKRFIKIYSKNKNLDYAYYMLGIVYYEQIVDEKKDLKSINNAKNTFKFVIKNFPNTDYALDAKFKLGMVNNILASKEMYVANYYFDKKKWIAALNRFKIVINKYETTIYVEEALHRMVEINYHLGLQSEAKKYAQLLGYNYQSSEWYERSYSIFNESYEKNKKIKTKKNNIILRKFKSLFD
jgi:outer membrane protein assembly factor BamD